MARLAGWEPGMTATEEEKQVRFTMSPNPADHEIRLVFRPEARIADIDITLIDVYGRSLRPFTGILMDASGTITVPLDGVPPGLCFLAVRMGQSVYVQRFIKA